MPTEYERLIGELELPIACTCRDWSSTAMWQTAGDRDIVASPRDRQRDYPGGFVSQMPEYMAAGKSIVATAVSGCRFLLRDGAEYSWSPTTSGALAAGIETALTQDDDAARAMVQKAREKRRTVHMEAGDQCGIQVPKPARGDGR